MPNQISTITNQGGIKMPLKTNVCRCCLTDGCYKDISTEYFCSGQKEVYANMLLNTFNISISYQDSGGPSSASRLICDTCIAQLRGAAVFKQRVLESERVIVEYLHGAPVKESVLATTVELKAEPLQNESWDNEDFFTGHADTPTDDDEPVGVGDGLKYEVLSDLDLKDEISDGAMEGFDDEGELFVIKLRPNKNPVKAVKRSAGKIPLSKPLKVQNGVKKRKKSKSEKVASQISSNAYSDRIPIRIQSVIPMQPKALKTPIRELRMRENTLKLALNSNLCLFKSLKIKYQCFYCKDTFFDIKKLKEHSVSHVDERKKGMVIKRASFFKNAEITDLTCRLCHEKPPSLEALQEHLTATHDLTFHPEGHLLVPYRIEKDLACVFCQASFNSLMRLLVHMNKHYANHVCETCGASFINKNSLRIHLVSLHKEQKCPICTATFKSSSQRIRHIGKVHDTSRRPVRYCRLCEQTFKYSYLLVEHRIREHGAESQEVSCPECGRAFRNSAYLKVHVRSVHLKERNYPCAHCSMRFFTSTDRKRHERTHGMTEGEMFACDVCDTKFKSKDSWRRHANKKHALRKTR